MALVNRVSNLVSQSLVSETKSKDSRITERNAVESRNQTNKRGLNLNGSQHKDHSHHIQYPDTSGSSLQDLVTTTIRLLINPQPV